jgi:hypothetical protein
MTLMKSRTLKQANIHLRANNEATRTMRVRSLASSTAIETGKPIATIEKELITKQHSRYRLKLA